MTSNSTLVVAGFPGTGKTSFIAAFWQYLESRDGAGTVHLAAEPLDKKYLNHILDRWGKAIEITRTGTNANPSISLDLSPTKGDSFKLEIPDFYGEAFRDLWGTGTWHPDLLALAKQATGILFFVHPQTLGMPVTVSQENQALATAGLESPGDGSNNAMNARDAPTFDPSKSPTATKVVFLLQALQEAAGRRLPIAVVVSAWDTMKAEAIPDEWLREMLPLVHQFLIANAEASPFAVFGISALGGDIKEVNVRAKLLAHDDANKRIIVQEGTRRHNDITRPITWLANAGGKP